MKKFIHITETDPVKLDASRAVMDVFYTIIEGTKPAMFAALERRELFLMALYNGDQANTETYIRKYAPDATVEDTLAATVTGVGPSVAIVFRPKPGRGTVNEILKRQTGEDYPTDIH